MHTTRTVIARLESGRGKPSTRTLERFAEATGSRLRIVLEPAVWAVGVGCVAKGNSPNGLLGEAEGIEVTHGHLVERIGPVQGGGVAS